MIGPLTYIFNKSLRNGIVPGKLKIAVVYPIHKKESRMKIGNFRPVSSFPIICKIYEKLVYIRLKNFFDKHNIIHKHQFGFQKGKSTEHAIPDINKK